MENLDKIVGYFEPGKTPTYEEFKKSWTSFWHKSEKQPITQVLGLNDSLNSLDNKKANKEDLANVVGGLNPMGSVEKYTDLAAKPKRNNDSYFVKDRPDENGDPYIFRYDAELGEWINTEQVVYKDVAKKIDISASIIDMSGYTVTIKGFLNNTGGIGNYGNLMYSAKLPYNNGVIRVSGRSNISCPYILFYDVKGILLGVLNSTATSLEKVERIIEKEKIPENTVTYVINGYEGESYAISTTTSDLSDRQYLDIAENVLNNLNIMHPTSHHGEGVDGGVISDGNKKVTIPIGAKGNASYLQAHFYDNELIKIIKDAYMYDIKSVYGVIKIKVSDNKIGDYISGHFQVDSVHTSVARLVARLKVGNYIYFIVNNWGDLSTLKTHIRLGVQFFPSGNTFEQDFVFEYVGMTVFIRNNEIYARLLDEKVAEKKNITEKVYGTSKYAQNVFQTFVGGLACLNTPTEMAGYLRNIYVRSNGAGSMRFGIGIIDQRSWAIIRDTFSVDVVAGNNTVDVFSRKITIKKDELLFIYLDNATTSPCFGVNAETDPDLLLYNDKTASGVLSRLATTYGGYITLTWEVITINSEYFATKNEIEIVNGEIKDINETIIQTKAQIGTAPDYFGNKYELRVVNNVVVPIPMRYKKCVCVGNSITYHGKATDLWWGEWGMAASKKEYDYVSIVEKGLQVVDNTATATRLNAAAWERNFNIDKNSLFGGVAADTDLIVFRFAENVVDTANFENAFDDLVSYFFAKCPRAKYLITGVFWRNTTKDTALMNVATKYGITFIQLSDLDTLENKWKLGDLVWGDDGEQHAIINIGVANHPNDNGMKHIGNRILTAAGYETIE
ncbi:hypothetical protein [Dysgonomonas sp. ZJ279]|uniref:hypothetical protein n=1 Tax=Dysgonomonas sp. ZJ279 TaxID=2709796 RepID=UPI0013EAD26D|nr:hypothetical protein [Dysgonomonas sp. ZJ279]